MIGKGNIFEYEDKIVFTQAKRGTRLLKKHTSPIQNIIIDELEINNLNEKFVDYKKYLVNREPEGHITSGFVNWWEHWSTIENNKPNPSIINNELWNKVIYISAKKDSYEINKHDKDLTEVIDTTEFIEFLNELIYHYNNKHEKFIDSWKDDAHTNPQQEAVLYLKEHFEKIKIVDIEKVDNLLAELDFEFSDKNNRELKSRYTQKSNKDIFNIFLNYTINGNSDEVYKRIEMLYGIKLNEQDKILRSIKINQSWVSHFNLQKKIYNDLNKSDAVKFYEEITHTKVPEISNDVKEPFVEEVKKVTHSQKQYTYIYDESNQVMNTRILDNLTLRDDNQFELYQTQATWVLTLPKIASQWCENNLTSCGRVSISKTDLHCSGAPQSSEEVDIHKPSGVFALDWNNIVEGKKPKRKVIILTRNPLDKWVTGLHQDVISQYLETSFITSPFFRTSLQPKFSPYDIDLFQRFLRDNDEKGGLDGLSDLPIQLLPICWEAIKVTLDDYFSNTNGLFQTSFEGHKSLVNGLILKLIKYPPKDFLSEYVSFVDIDKQDIGATLSDTYGYNTNSKKYNPRGKVSKYILWNLLNKHYRNIVQYLLQDEIGAYNDYITDIYPKELYEEGNNRESYIKPLIDTSTFLFVQKKEKFNVDYDYTILCPYRDWDNKIKSFSYNDCIIGAPHDIDRREQTLSDILKI